MKKITNWKSWAKCAGVTASSVIGVSAVLSDVNWVAVASASVLSGVLSLLTSVAGLPEAE